MGISEHVKTLARKVCSIIIEIPTSHFISGYQRGGDKPKKRENYPRYSFVVTDWQVIGRRAEAYWKAIWIPCLRNGLSLDFGDHYRIGICRHDVLAHNFSSAVVRTW